MSMQGNTIIQKIRGVQSSEKPEPISGMALLKMIGMLALLLPTILCVGAAILQDCQLVQNSMSAYYHTIMRNFFVGTLCAIAFCMFAYYGYNKNDNTYANLAGIFALGVAFFPTSVGAPFTGCLSSIIDSGINNTIHFISAALLFIMLAIFSLVIFTQKEEDPKPRKLFRNKVYVFCGIVIIICILLIAIYSFFFNGKYIFLDELRPVFYLEALALAAFGVSWLTKGEMLWADKQE